MLASRPKRMAGGIAAAKTALANRGDARAARPAYGLALRFSIRSSTTLGSARVEVSPRLPNSLSAILRRMRRMIFPDRVFGRPGAN